MKITRLFSAVLVLMFLIAAVGCAPAATPAPAAAQPAAPAAAKTYKDMTLCYPQLGAESDWRTANTASFKETAEKLGVKLVFSDAQQKQENQISAMRACIQQGVDVIALPPVVETGWDAVLQEAKDANIPVIIVDRSVSADKSLYVAHIGSDMVLEGKKAGDEMNKLLPNGGNILDHGGVPGTLDGYNRIIGATNMFPTQVLAVAAPPCPALQSAAPRASAKPSTRTSPSSIPRPVTSTRLKPNPWWKPS